MLLFSKMTGIGLLISRASAGRSGVFHIIKESSLSASSSSHYNMCATLIYSSTHWITLACNPDRKERCFSLRALLLCWSVYYQWFYHISYYTDEVASIRDYSQNEADDLYLQKLHCVKLTRHQHVPYIGAKKRSQRVRPNKTFRVQGPLCFGRIYIYFR
jgi:hypothetical protein